MAFVAYACCDLLHEAGHALAAQLPLGVIASSISTVAVTTSRSSPVVAGAGSLVNLALSLGLLLSFSDHLSPTVRYFFWLLGSIDLFNATGYLLYSGASGSGDMAVTLGALAAPRYWRPLAVIVGMGLYAAAVQASSAGLRSLVLAKALPTSQVRTCCLVSYWSGGLLLIAGAALNPTSHWLILTSGAAVGFGAMIGLILLPRLLARKVPAATASPTLQPGRGWLLGGALAAAVFVAVFGPGISLIR